MILMMKKGLFAQVVFGLCMILSCVTLAMERTTDISAGLLDFQNQPTEHLKSLLALFNLPQTDLKTIVDATQKTWLRPAGKERWEMEEVAADKTEQLKALFAKIGLIHEMKPSQKNYDYAVLLGSRLASTQKRVNYLLNLWHQGLRFNSIVVLTGERPLDPKIESIETPTGKATTECTMMQAVFTNLNAPEAFKNIPVTFVSVPMITTKEGQVRRPTTGDTVQEWLKVNPKPGNCLVISNQPFVGYQDSVVKTLLPKSFVVESAGCAAESTHNAEILDTIARWLYQEKIRRNC